MKSNSILCVAILIFLGGGCAPRGYYINRDAKIEVRAISPDPASGECTQIKDLHNNIYCIGGGPLVSSMQIHGVAVEKDHLVLYFNRSDWISVRTRTELYNLREVAIICSDVVLSTGILRDPLVRSALVRRSEDLDIVWFLEGFTKGPKPPYADAEYAYVDFLRQWIELHPDDVDSVSTLAYIISKKGTRSSWLEALPLYERLAGEPSPESDHLSRLATAYVVAQRYDEAIAAAERSLELSHDTEVPFAYGHLGLVHAAAGNRTEALKALNTAVQLLRDTPFPWEVVPLNYPPELAKVLGQPPKREDAISRLEALIRQVESSM